MKYRKNKVKREHSIIENALVWLEQLSSLLEVTDIIPGVIDVNRSPERGIVYKYETKTGCKLLLKSNGSIQEVFIVTKKPYVVQAWVNKEFPVENSETGICPVTTKRIETSKKKISRTSANKVQECLPNYTSNKMAAKNKRKSKNPFKPVISSKVPESKIADRLDRDTLQSLGDLKKSLQDKKNRKSRY